MHAELNCVQGQMYCHQRCQSLVQPNCFFRGLRIVLTQTKLTTPPCSVPPRAAMNSDVEALATLDLGNIPDRTYLRWQVQTPCVQTKHCRKEQKIHTIPWGGRLRAHALGESPEGAPRDTPAGPTTNTQCTGSPPNNNTQHGEQQTVASKQNTVGKNKKHTQYPGAEGSGRTLLGRAQKVLQETLPRGPQQIHRAREAHQKTTRNTGSRKQSRPNKTL